MSKSKRAVSLLIAFLMLLGLMPFGMLADGPTGELPDIVIMKVDEEGNPLEGGLYALADYNYMRENLWGPESELEDVLRYLKAFPMQQRTKTVLSDLTTRVLATTL